MSIDIFSFKVIPGPSNVIRQGRLMRTLSPSPTWTAPITPDVGGDGSRESSLKERYINKESLYKMALKNRHSLFKKFN